MRSRWGGPRNWVWAGITLLLAACPLLTGCQFFFVCQKTSCTDSTTTTTTTASSSGDYAYIANSTSGATYLAGYELSTGSPVAITGSPYTLGFVPSAIAVAPGNALMFIASAAGGVIYAYTLASDGVPSIANNGVAVANEVAAGMDITADGKYLFVLNSLATTGLTNVDEYSITNSSGVLQYLGTSTSALSSITPEGIKVAPSGDFVVVAQGSAGDAIFALSNEKLTSSVSSQVIQLSGSVGDFGVTIDSNDVIYLARTGQVVTYTATAAGAATLISNTTASSTTGSGDHALALSSTDAYLYTGNASVNTLSGFSNSSGKLGVLSGSPYTAPSGVAAVAADNSGKYVVAAGYNSGGIVEYAIGSSGALTASSTTASTGSSGITVMAVTH